MAKNLVIVESPAKAKTIMKYLGKDYKVLASMGHLRDLPEKNIGVDIENHFTPKYQPIKGKKELIKELSDTAKKSEKVYLATDPDREGEAISWHIAQMLKIDEASDCRITFNEITKSAVTNAIEHPRSIDMDLVDAQQARRILDRIVGYKLSPLLWKKVKKGLSAGRVQSVATRIVCDRELEIQNFKSEEFWTVTADLNKEAERFLAKLALKNGKKFDLHNEEETSAAVEQIKNQDFAVEKVKKSKKTRRPYPPFITSTLQQEASRKLGFTAKRTMMAAQQLYEGIDLKERGLVGLITYMRTDSLRVAQEAMEEAKKYIVSRFSEEYAPKSYNVYKSKKGNVQDAHEAIRPSIVDLAPDDIKAYLSNDQYKLYKLIWERFIASQMSSAMLNVVSVDIKAGDYTFKTGGSTVLFDGFMKLYVESTDEEKEEDNQKMPALNEGDKLTLNKLDPKQNFTKPPARYTEASLIKAMEENGIGRPSTYAPTITTILNREYVEKEGKTLKPTELGMIITDLMKNHFKDIVDVKFTANMEEELDKIEEGNIDWISVLDDFYGGFEKVLKAAESIEKVKLKEEVTDVICEKCGRNMVIKSGRYGKFLACPGFPECKNAKPITVEVSGVLCPLCGGKVLQKKSKRGKVYYGCEHNPTCGFMTWDEPTNEKCELCGSVMAKKRYGKGSKLYCINQECPNTLKTRKKADGEEEKTAAKKTTAKKAAPKKTTAKKSPAKKKTVE